MDINYNNKTKIQKLIAIFTSVEGFKAHISNNKGFYIFILGIMFFRSFVYSYNLIPSGSMMPTLMPGDQVLVDKTAYNVKLPLFNKTIININEPEVGDIITFYQEKDNKDIYMVKRVIAKGGDEIYFKNNIAYVNGNTLKYSPNDSVNEYEKLHVSYYDFSETDDFKNCMVKYKELGKASKTEEGILTCNEKNDSEYSFYEQEDYNGNVYNIGLKPMKGMNEKVVKHLNMHSKVIKVPENKLFVMGDYRNGSFDSRFFGFIDKDQVVGKVTKVVFNFNDLKHDIFGDERYWKNVN